MKKVWPMFLAAAAPLLAGFLGSLATTPAISGWYRTLEKPVFTPPDWVFAPVWTTLFVLMGLSSYLVWRRRQEGRHEEVTAALGFYAIQLGLNLTWSLLFFGWKNLLLALVEIVVLWLMLVLTMVRFWKLSRTAGLLLLPYLAWTSFAACLNFSIFQLNR